MRQGKSSAWKALRMDIVMIALESAPREHGGLFQVERKPRNPMCGGAEVSVV